MNAETALWVWGVALVPLISWCMWMTWHVVRCREGIAKLVHIHEHPDDYGFGTSRQTRIIEENTQAMKSLAHYIRWALEREHGTPPPPPPFGHDQEMP